MKSKNPEVADVFQAQVDGKFAALKLLDSEIETFSFDINEVILGLAEEILEKPWKRIQTSITKEIQDLWHKGQELRGKKNSSDEAWEPYQNEM